MKRDKTKTVFCLTAATILVLSVSFSIMAVSEETKLYEKRHYQGPKIVFDEKGNPNGIDTLNNGKGKPQKPPKPPSPPEVDKWAVIVGAANYPGWINDLNYPDDDAMDMYAYLLSMGYPEDNIKLLIDAKAKSGSIIRAIDWMNKQEQTETSECVFFFSGHGSTYDGYNDGDTEYTDEAVVATDNVMILDGQLRAKFSTFTSKKITLIFDTCYSGGMDDLIGVHTSTTYDGRTVVTACDENELSYDGQSDLQNGVFTYYFIEGLYTINNVEDAFSYANPLAQQYVQQNYGSTMNPKLYDTYTGKWEF